MISGYFLMLKSLLWLLLAAAIIDPSFSIGGRSNLTGSCIQIERQALLEFRSKLIDPSNRLASWNHTGVNCCTWYGIVCHEVTGHVLELHLRSISYFDYWESNPTPSDKGYLDIVFGGKVSPSLLKLRHLRYLDLSNNDFQGIHIPKFFGSLVSLRHLNLSQFGFSGKIPHQLGNLSNLQYLNLGNEFRYSLFIDNNLQWLSGLPSLKFLDLSYVERVNTSNWLENVNTLPSLKELHLSGCHLSNVKTAPLLNINFSSLFILDLSDNMFVDFSQLSWISQLQLLMSLNLGDNQFQGPIPNSLQNLTSIGKLDLSWNNFTSSIPKWLYGFRYLESLYLHDNLFLEGDISNGFGNITSLVTLGLGYTALKGEILSSFKNLCNLRVLYLSGIKINKEVSEVLQNLNGCILNGLKSLYLSNCQLSGQLTHHLGQFKALEELFLSYNLLSGPITHHLGQFKALEELDLSYNLLSGPIPLYLGQLKSLKRLSLSYNNLSGTLPVNLGGLSKLEYLNICSNFLKGDVLEVHFENLTELRYLYTSQNQLRLRVGSEWSPPFQKMRSLHLDSCPIGPPFPTWLVSLKYLSSLNLSNSGISSSIPLWFWKFSTLLSYVDLSCNKIKGVLPTVLDTPQLEVLDLRANLLEGPLPSISSSVVYLDLSNNSFSGSLSKFLCSDIKGTNSLEFLILKRNQLEGQIPDCWTDWGYLTLIHLGDNKFHGHIPKSVGTLNWLLSLHLRNNNLSGKIPFSFRNCQELVTLDLSNNQLRGVIPKWIQKSFLAMSFLNLRENNFRGQIPEELCHLTSLQILDLASNHFFGPIPNCIKNFSAMVMGNVSSRSYYMYYYFMEEADVVTKGQLVEYNTIFNLVRSLDLSSNKLFGEIPKGITSLTGLQSLNLSCNILSGRIPEGIGAMKSLESIDFSQNHLSSEIPQTLANLNFLNHLNLSNNNLSGRIPLGTQIQSFDSSSFYGNKELCGKPLTNNCTEDRISSEAPKITKEVGKSIQVDWFYVNMALGFVVGLGGVIGPLVYNKRWRYEYFLFLDCLGDKIYWSFH